jgi:hypothetical protein
MITSVFGKLAARLATMKGFPAWSDAVMENYFMDLADIPDAIGEQMARGVLRQFDERPSVKQLREWAAQLAPRKSFDIADLSPRPALTHADANRPRLTSSASRLTSSLTDEKPGLAEYAGGIVAASGAPPAVVKQMMARFRTQAKQEETISERWGLQFREKSTGRISRGGATHTEAAARQLAEERNQKWPHVETTAYRHGDPMPESVPPPRGDPDPEGSAPDESEAAFVGSEA